MVAENIRKTIGDYQESWASIAVDPQYSIRFPKNIDWAF